MNISRIFLALLSLFIFAGTALAQEESPTLSVDDLLAAIDDRCVCEFDPEAESSEGEEEKLRAGQCRGKILSKMKLVSRVLLDLGILVSEDDKKALARTFKAKAKSCKQAQKAKKKHDKGNKDDDSSDDDSSEDDDSSDDEPAGDPS